MLNIQIDKEVLLHEIEDVEYELYKKTIYIVDYIELALQQLTPKQTKAASFVCDRANRVECNLYIFITYY